MHIHMQPRAQEVSTIPFAYRCHHRHDGKYKYLGGVLGPDGCIYAIPSDADYVLKVGRVLVVAGSKESTVVASSKSRATCSRSGEF